MPATDVRYHYVSLDSDHDISADTLVVSLDQLTWAPTTAVAEPATAAGLDAPATGRTRYWWQILTGPGQDVEFPADGRNILYGRLTDNPETLHLSWTIYV